jgi:hypothetical protein
MKMGRGIDANVDQGVETLSDKLRAIETDEGLAGLDERQGGGESFETHSGLGVDLSTLASF